jgi:hypothetical protein
MTERIGPNRQIRRLVLSVHGVMPSAVCAAQAPSPAGHPACCLVLAGGLTTGLTSGRRLDDQASMAQLLASLAAGHHLHHQGVDERVDAVPFPVRAEHRQHDHARVGFDDPGPLRGRVVRSGIGVELDQLPSDLEPQRPQRYAGRDRVVPDDRMLDLREDFEQGQALGGDPLVRPRRRPTVTLR